MSSLIDTTTDGHMHTRLCHHARGEMEDYVRAAIGKGLKKIIFLEHLETGINYFEKTWLADEDFAAYFEEGAHLKRKYQNQLDIGLGVEVGYNPSHRREILARLSAYTWDRIGISYHFLADDSRHLNLVSSKKANISALDRLGVDRVIECYFTNLIEAVNTMPGQVLCHFDAVLRHHPDVDFIDPGHELIRELLDAVSRKEMAVEVNASGFALRGEPYPSVALLREVVKRNIPLVAGSDAHRPEDVGRYFKEISRLALELS